MEKDLISIVIPVYNQVRELEQALISIKDQTYKNIEIIIEEDKQHEGAPVMRNRGLARARGEYIIFWDADIVAVPKMLEELYQALKNNPEVSFAYCDYYFKNKKMPSKKFAIETLRKNNYIHSTSLIRRKAAIKWDENLKRFQDWDLWLTMIKKGETGIYVPKILFTIIAQGTISTWLPSFAYKKPWKYLPGFRKKVKKYEKAKNIIIKKHRL